MIKKRRPKGEKFWGNQKLWNSRMARYKEKHGHRPDEYEFRINYTYARKGKFLLVDVVASASVSCNATYTLGLVPILSVII